MKTNTWLVNILTLAAIGATFVATLAHAVGVPVAGADTGPQLAVLALGGTLVGGVVTTMVRLATPDPDPAVPASVVAQLLHAFGVSPPSSLDAALETTETSPGRAILWLTLLGAVLVGGMVFVLESEAAIVTVAGGFVGGLVALASDMVKPPPNPAVPASVVTQIIDRLVDGAPKSRPATG